MRRIVALGFLVVLVAVACTPTTSDVSSTEAVATTQAEQDVVDRLVVGTIQGVVKIVTATGEVLTTIEPPEGSFYRSPTWLDSLTVVFSETAENGEHGLVAVDASSGVQVWRAAMETPPFYYSPAPPESSLATTSLRNNPVGAGLIAEAVDRSGAVARLSTESPFYTAWSPDGSRLAVHIAGTRMDIVEGSSVETILSETGFFQAPAWTTAGLLTLRSVDGTQFLSVRDGETFLDVAQIEGPAGFVASGNRVAIQLTTEDNSGAVQAGLSFQVIDSVPLGRLMVLDLGTDTRELVTREPALGFQWNQTGDSLIYATVGAAGRLLVWHVWSGGESRELAMFTPQPPWLSNFLPFFDQYAQSVNIWSASGDRIAYPSIADALPVVVVESVDGSGTVLVEDGTWASWAPRN